MVGAIITPTSSNHINIGTPIVTAAASKIVVFSSCRIWVTPPLRNLMRSSTSKPTAELAIVNTIPAVDVLMRLVDLCKEARSRCHNVSNIRIARFYVRTSIYDRFLTLHSSLFLREPANASPKGAAINRRSPGCAHPAIRDSDCLGKFEMNSSNRTDPFETTVDFILDVEGGLVDDPSDPGGL